MSETAPALQLLEQLVAQAKFAKVGPKVHYSSVRVLRTSVGEEFNMFAISSTENQDIAYARTPELAKFIALLMNLSSDVTAALIAGLRRAD